MSTSTETVKIVFKKQDSSFNYYPTDLSNNIQNTSAVGINYDDLSDGTILIDSSVQLELNKFHLIETQDSPSALMTEGWQDLSQSFVVMFDNEFQITYPETFSDPTGYLYTIKNYSNLSSGDISYDNYELLTSDIENFLTSEDFNDLVVNTNNVFFLYNVTQKNNTEGVSLILNEESTKQSLFNNLSSAISTYTLDISYFSIEYENVGNIPSIIFTSTDASWDSLNESEKKSTLDLFLNATADNSDGAMTIENISAYGINSSSVTYVSNVPRNVRIAILKENTWPWIDISDQTGFDGLDITSNPIVIIPDDPFPFNLTTDTPTNYTLKFAFTYGSSNSVQLDIPGTFDVQLGDIKAYDVNGLDFYLPKDSTNNTELVYSDNTNDANNWDISNQTGFDSPDTTLGYNYYDWALLESTSTLSQSGEICFPAGTSVKTDQGFIDIEKVNKNNTIDGLKVLKVTKVMNKCDYLILFKKDSIKANYPNKDTLVSRFHKIYNGHKGKMAMNYVNGKTIVRKPTKRDFIYNILLEKYHKMEVHGMQVESLNPNNKFAKI